MSRFVSIADVVNAFPDIRATRIVDIERRFGLASEVAGDLRKRAFDNRRIAALRSEYGFSNDEAEAFVEMYPAPRFRARAPRETQDA